MDADSEEELLLIHATDTDNIISVYEVSEKEVVLKSEFKISNAERYEVFSQEFSFIPTNHGTFVMYACNVGGALSDGYWAEISLFRYNGTDLIPAMRVLQTERGSAGFQHIAYKYDLNGVQISNDLVYDDDEWEIYDEDNSILASQFAEYGIEIDKNICMYDSIGAFENLISDNTNREVLCNLNVWADSDWRNDKLFLL